MSIYSIAREYSTMRVYGCVMLYKMQERDKGLINKSGRPRCFLFRDSIISIYRRYPFVNVVTPFRLQSVRPASSSSNQHSFHFLPSSAFK